MRLLTVILISLLFSLNASGENRVVQCGNTGGEECCKVENKLLLNILELAKNLQECRFEVPQHASTNIVRPQQLRPTKVIQEHWRLAPMPDDISGSKQRHRLKESHIAISTARHSRGYYIYAIRHIII